jgi:uroporphyrinogen-III synthase
MIAAAQVGPPAAGFTRLLHLCGRDHVATDATAIAVYASVPRAAALPPLDGAIALLHSRRAAEAFAALVPAAERPLAMLVAISPAALAGAGDGWTHAEATDTPTDAAMAALALRLARD